jgi:hypothetical protein
MSAGCASNSTFLPEDAKLHTIAVLSQRTGEKAERITPQRKKHAEKRKSVQRGARDDLFPAFFS